MRDADRGGFGFQRGDVKFGKEREKEGFIHKITV